MVSALLFDVDGVLVHPWRFRSTLERNHGITPAMTMPFFRGPFVACMEGRADVLDLLPEYLTSWGWTGSPSDFMDTWLAAENAPDEAVLSIVKEIRESGVPCFVASSQERRRAQYLSHEMNFSHLFDGQFYSCDIGLAKPAEGYFRAVAHLLGRSGPELLFFDDALANVEGARAAGWSAEHFTNPEELRGQLAQYLGPLLDRG